MTRLVLVIFAALALANCGRKAPLDPVPGTILGDFSFANYAAPSDETEDVYEQPDVDEAWYETDPDDDDDDKDDDDDE